MLQNLGLLISFPLAGTGAFYLVRYLTANTAGALLGGFLFAFNPSHVEHVMHHAGVSSIEFIPFFVLTYLLIIERKSALFLLLTIILYAINALLCWYYLFYIAYFIGFHTLYVAVRDQAMPRGWQLLTPVACVTGVIVTLSPMLIPMVKAAIGGAPVYVDRGGDIYVADVFAYLAFPRFHLLAPLADGIYRRLTGSEWESTVYLGFVNLAVLAGLCLSAWHKDSRLLTYVLSGMAAFCIFASGEWLHVLGHRIIPMPDAALSHLPFFRNVRAPSRAIVFVYMFLAIGIGQATALAWGHRSRPMVRSGIVGVAALMVLDFFPVHPLAMTSVACSSGLAVIRNDPERDFGVLDLPSGRRPDYDVESNFYMLQQAACHSRPIVQGNISRNVVASLRDRLEAGDLQAEKHQLAAAKVKYIVINRDNMGLLFRWHPEDGPKDRYPLNFPTVYDGSDLTVLRVY